MARYILFYVKAMARYILSYVIERTRKFSPARDRGRCRKMAKTPEPRSSPNYVTAHSETTFHSVATVSETVLAGDMPQMSTTSHSYDENDEVIQYEHWEDAWQKIDCSG